MHDKDSTRAHSASFDFRELYREALFGMDSHLFWTRITEGQRAPVRREQQLFVDSNRRAAECEAVSDALNAHYALRMCLGLGAQPPEIPLVTLFGASIALATVHDESTTYWALSPKADTLIVAPGQRLISLTSACSMQGAASLASALVPKVVAHKCRGTFLHSGL